MSYRNPIAFLTSLTLLFVLPVATSFAQQSYGSGGYGHGGYMHGWGGSWHGMVLGPLMMLIFFAITAAVIALIVRWIWGAGKAPHHGSPMAGTPLDILKERFARGEIDAAEFEERRQVLEK